MRVQPPHRTRKTGGCRPRALPGERAPLARHTQHSWWGNKIGLSPLYVASQEGHSDVVDILLEAGADVHQATTEDGDVPLGTAAEHGHTETVQRLLKAGVNVNQQNKEGSTALLYAGWKCHSEVVKLLLGAGARDIPNKSRIPSSYKFDSKHPGIRFFGDPWKQSVTSAGAHISWKEEIGVEFNIPPEAVPEGRELDLSVWPCFDGPFLLPDGYELASPVFLISPTFEFSQEITLTLWHFSNLETVEDSERMVFLSAPFTPHTKRAGKKPAYEFRVLEKGVFEPRQDYGQISLTHFCYVGVGRKRKKHSSPSDSPLSKKPRDETDENRYVYQVYREMQFGDRAIFSAFLDQKLYFTELEENIKKYSTQLWSTTSSVPISIEGDRVKLKWPSNTGWVITPDREPCELTKEMVDSHQRHPYPQMISLEVEKDHTSSTISPIPVEILGIRGKGKRFILKPKLRQTGLNLQSSLSSPSHTLQSSQMVSYSSSREQADTAGAGVEQARQGPSHPNLRDLLNNIHTTEWYKFGLQLTSNIAELNTIKTDNKGDAKTALQETLNLVLREDPDLSWQKVVEALQTIGEVAMARTINKEFC